MKKFLLNVSAPIRSHIFIYLAAFIVVSLAASSSLILKFEAPYPDSGIKTISDAVWWSTVGISTIGIGNVVPESVAGRYLTLFLMIDGVIIFSVVTAKIAAFFTEEEVKEDLDQELKVIEGDLNKVEKDIAGEIATEDKQIEDKLAAIEKKVRKLEKKK